MDKVNELRYLPLFEQDVAEVRDYIAIKLQNPKAAERLIADTQTAIQERLTNPTAFKTYSSKHDRKHPYYRIFVRNYTVFYVVIDNIMEVRRFLYSRRDISRLL
jgi:plasmid stabilization system protein ParE